MLSVFIFAFQQMYRIQRERLEKEKEDELLCQEARASEEKASGRQASVLQILSKEYSSVYYVDLEEDAGVPLRLSDVSFEIYGLEMDRSDSFRKVYENYIRTSAAPDQAEELLRFADPEFLRRTLKDDEILTHLYRIVRDGREIYAQLRIARAEDNDLNAEIATVQLEELGIRVIRAIDGREAVRIFSENPPNTFDVVLIDIMMPLMNGYEATRATRAMQRRPDARTIPIIAVTANAFAEDIQESLKAGMNAHIAEPISMDEVVKTIMRNLN